ncbi:MAG TPA: hypothetical protein PK096_01480 [Candidatus Saccharibacteria bacterium]|nr:hypothetical protein [Candidatus Saccharibacteria bacterium]HRK94018.1 hypothetical protein [Candidatus Saccharibacteria bacterium]
MKILLGLFLLAHGLLHASYLTPKPDDPNYPFDFHKGWFPDLVGQAAGPIGTILVVVVVGAFLLAALSLFGVPGFSTYGQLFVSVGAIASLILLVLFWHSWLILGVVINLVLLVGIYAFGWKFGA